MVHPLIVTNGGEDRKCVLKSWAVSSMSVCLRRYDVSGVNRDSNTVLTRGSCNVKHKGNQEQTLMCVWWGRGSTFNLVAGFSSGFTSAWEIRWNGYANIEPQMWSVTRHFNLLNHTSLSKASVKGAESWAWTCCWWTDLKLNMWSKMKSLW